MSTLPEALLCLNEKLLSEPSAQPAKEIISSYFSFFDKQTIHHHLWLFTIAILTNDEMEKSEDGRNRYNHIFFYEYTKLLIDAMYELYTRNK